MSSETSTEPQALQPWQLFTLAGLLGATVVVFVSREGSRAGVIILSLIIFAAAAVGLAAWRTFAPFAARGHAEGSQILGGRTRAALEREKALALRAIKELEFDRAMGKIADQDFAEMSGRLRSRAAGLIRQLDAGTGYREAIAREIEKRIGPAAVTASAAPKSRQPATGGEEVVSSRLAEHVAVVVTAESTREALAAESDAGPASLCGTCGAANDKDARFCIQCGARRCLACGTSNDRDARFCKQCGERQGAGA